jgi:predicted nuclease of predicted toxin-antitoxin system
MWLLDANMDVHLLGVFSELGIPCESAIDKGWRELTNGQLVSAAAEAGFTCILTHDRLFAESARQTLPMLPDLSIIVVRLTQRPWREYVRQFRLAWEKQPIAPTPGSVIHWPADSA